MNYVSRVMRHTIVVVTLAAAVFVVGACSPKVPPPGAMTASGEPVSLHVQHVLVGFADAVGLRDRGDMSNAAQHRTRDEAEKLANQILERARKGEDFGALMKQYTDDPGEGIYGMVNNGEDNYDGYYGRHTMTKGFGDVAFKLKPGEVGICGYHIKDSPFGFHVIKRLD